MHEIWLVDGQNSATQSVIGEDYRKIDVTEMKRS